MTSMAKTQPAGSLLDGYGVNGLFDEMFGRDGKIFGHYEKLHSAFGAIPRDDFHTKRHSVDLNFLRQGVTFNVYGDSRGADGPTLAFGERFHLGAHRPVD